MSETPAVSVVMSVRGGERFLAAAIESVLAQTLTDLELVVMDDGSSDSSPQILAAYASSDERVLVHRHEHAGLATSLNRGIGHARSPLIARLDADDVARPRRLELQVAHLAQNSGVGLVGGAVAFIDDDGRRFAEARYPETDAEIRRAFASTTPFVHSAVTMRREAFDAVGGYRAAFPHAEDLDLWLRIGAVSELANLAETVVAYRIHSRQSTVTELERQSLSALGARVAWRAREQGVPDPFERTALVDRDALRAAGASEADLTIEFVRLAVWLAKTLSRAGREEAAAELFATAEERARSRSGSHALVAFVKRERAKRLRARGRRLAAGRTAVSAALEAARGRVGRSL
jgi:GT2 family glycosyltransferase